jgi:acetyl-CoA synthetase
MISFEQLVSDFSWERELSVFSRDISKGFNFSHEAVMEAAVVGKPDQAKGEIVEAYAVLKAGYEPTPELAEEIQLFVKKTLSKHQYPREVEFVDDLPKTPSGKVQRFNLRARAKQA